MTESQATDSATQAARNKEIALAIWGRDLNRRDDPDGDEFRAHFEQYYTEDYWNHASEPGKDRGIANAKAGGTDVSKKGGQSGSYEDWSVEDLRDRAKELDIEGRSDMNKDDLVDALRNH